MVAMIDFHWVSVLTDEIFDKTFEARVHTLLADVTSQNVNVLEVEFLEALSATTQLHTLFQSTRHAPVPEWSHRPRLTLERSTRVDKKLKETQDKETAEKTTRR